MRKRLSTVKVPRKIDFLEQLQGWIMANLQTPTSGSLSRSGVTLAVKLLPFPRTSMLDIGHLDSSRNHQGGLIGQQI